MRVYNFIMLARTDCLRAVVRRAYYLRTLLLTPTKHKSWWNIYPAKSVRCSVLGWRMYCVLKKKKTKKTCILCPPKCTMNSWVRLLYPCTQVLFHKQAAYSTAPRRRPSLIARKPRKRTIPGLGIYTSCASVIINTLGHKSNNTASKRVPYTYIYKPYKRSFC